jgi:cytochrome c peroxidase
MLRTSLRLSTLGLAALLAAGAPAQGEPLAFSLPPGVLEPIVPADNPVTREKVELGKKLYFDARLSSDDTVACASCHAPQSGFADPRGTPTSAGVGGKLGTRNSPTSMNAAFLGTQFWDGRAATLEEQALLPIVNPVEMALPNHAVLEQKLGALPEYAPLFQAAFGDPKVTAQRVGQALASFERTLLSVQAPIDRFLAGDAAAISEAAKRGWALYNGKARCNNCHGHVESFPFFTDDLFHNIGVGVTKVDFESVSRRAAAAIEGDPEAVDKLALQDAEASELGRFLVTRQRKDIGAFKTSQLRNIALTAPYMHDGSEKTLADVVEYYDRGGNPNPFLDGGIRPLGLTATEKADLVELMKTFTSDDLARFQGLVALMPK